MSPIIRTWLAFAAIGTGLIHVALVVSSPLPVAIVLAVIALAELAWGVGLMASGRLLVPRLALAGALVPIILWSAVLLVAIESDATVISSLRFLPLSLAAVLEIFVAGTIAIQIRRRFMGGDTTGDTSASVDAATQPAAGRYLLGLIIGSLAVASLTTPALAATQAGDFAVPHGEHSFFQGDEGHGH
ncbi:MAG: hypothetical protein ACOH1T_09795 [Microbacteriaceae bacterium]